jgi:hypothetical protein
VGELEFILALDAAGFLFAECVALDGTVVVRRKIGEEKIGPDVDAGGHFSVFQPFEIPTYRVRDLAKWEQAVEVILSIPEWRKPIIRVRQEEYGPEYQRELALLSQSLQRSGEDASPYRYARLAAGWVAGRVHLEIEGRRPASYKGSYRHWIRSFVRDEFADAILPGAHLYAAERRQLRKRGFSLIQHEFTDEFEDQLHRQGLQTTEPGPDVIRRLVMEDAVQPTPRDRAFLTWRDRLGPALDSFLGKTDWSRQYERRLHKRPITPWGKHLVLANSAIQQASRDIPYVRTLAGRSFPTPPARVRKEIPSRMKQNGHRINGQKPGWRVWSFTAYPPNGNGHETWYAYQNGGAPIFAQSKVRLVEKVAGSEK